MLTYVFYCVMQSIVQLFITVIFLILMPPEPNPFGSHCISAGHRNRM